MDALRSAAVLLLVILFTQLATLRAEDPCLQPRVAGRCKLRYHRFFFNSSSGTCEAFIFGHCEANANNFKTLEACQLACYNRCQQPKQPGPCQQQFSKFFFNSQTGACEEFIYGGCDGNRNNFDTLEDCQATCLTIPPQP